MRRRARARLLCSSVLLNKPDREAHVIVAGCTVRANVEGEMRVAYLRTPSGLR